MSDDKQNREPDSHLNPVEVDHTRTVKIPKEQDHTGTVQVPINRDSTLEFSAKQARAASNDDDHITTLKLSGDDNIIKSRDRLTTNETGRKLLSNSTLPMDQKQKADDCIRLHGHSLEPHDTTQAPASAEGTRNDPLIGKVFAEKFEILALAGRGGMSAVYKALHTSLNKVVAIKLLYTHLAQNERNLRRFRQEAQVVSHLDHPGIVRLFDFGENAEGQPYLIMEFLKGQTLSAKLSQQAEPMGVDDALDYFVQLTEALAHAHRLGVIHRDLKPGNIFVEKNRDGHDQLKITDFGIAKLSGEESSVEHQALTGTGEVFGSPLYMSPEQCMGTPVDQRSDIYSLGCVMYEVLTGRPPHVGATAYETMQKHVYEDTEFPGNLRPEIRKYGDLELILLKAIAHKREIRYQSADQLLAALQHVHKDSPLDLGSSLLRAVQISRMRSKSSKVLYGALAITVTISAASLVFIASNWTSVQRVYRHTGVPVVQSKAPPGSWRKISEDAQKLINDGKFRESRPLLADSERIARKTDNTQDLLITLEKQAFIAQLLWEKGKVPALLSEIGKLHEKFDKEQAGSEELRLLLEAFNTNPDNPTDVEKEKFDSLSTKLIEWSRRLIRSKRYTEARNVLDTLTAKLDKVPSASEANRAGTRLATGELAVFEYRDPNRKDKKHDTWRNFQDAHDDLLALTEPKEEEAEIETKEATETATKTEAAESKEEVAKTKPKEQVAKTTPSKTGKSEPAAKTDSKSGKAGRNEDDAKGSDKEKGDGKSDTPGSGTDKAGTKDGAPPSPEAALPAMPSSPLSQEDFMWAVTLRAYVNAVLHSTTDPSIETSFRQVFETTAKQSLDYYTTTGAKSPHAALAYMLVADGMDKEYKHKTANELYEKALAIFIDKDNARDASHCYTEIANNLVELRKPMEALEFLREALKEANETPDVDDFLLAELYHALGKVYWHENNLGLAVDAYLNEATILQQITPPEDWLDLLNDLVEVYTQKSSVDDKALPEAEPFCLQWLSILEVNQQWETEPLQKDRWVKPIDSVKERLCYIYMNTKQHSRAEKLFKERMESLYKQPKNEVLNFTAWFPNLAQRYLVRRYEKRQFLDRLDLTALEAKKQLTRMYLAQALGTYGRIYWHMGEKEKAVETMLQAADVVKAFYNEDHYWAHRIILDCKKILAKAGMKAEAADMEALAEKLNRGE